MKKTVRTAPCGKFSVLGGNPCQYFPSVSSARDGRQRACQQTNVHGVGKKHQPRDGLLLDGLRKKGEFDYSSTRQDSPHRAPKGDDKQEKHKIQESAAAAAAVSSGGNMYRCLRLPRFKKLHAGAAAAPCFHGCVCPFVSPMHRITRIAMNRKEKSGCLFLTAHHEQKSKKIKHSVRGLSYRT